MSDFWQDILDIGPECVERFLTQQAFAELKPININLAGVSHLRGRYQVSRRNPSEHQVVFSVAGEGRLTTLQGSQRIGAKQLLLLPANQPFSIEINGNYWRHNWLLLGPELTWFRFPKQAVVRSQISPEKVEQAMKLLLQENQANRPDKLVIAHLCSLLQRYLLQQFTPQSEASHPLMGLEQQLRSALHYPWTVAEMAKRLAVSEPHCYRLFQHYYQCSPKQFLTRLRLEHGAYLLRESRWSLDVIASQLGYQDGFAFAHRFKRDYGMSPGRYRQQAQQ